MVLSRIHIRLVSTLLLLSLTVVAYQWSSSNSESVKADSTAEPDWNNPIPITNAQYGAKRPVVSSSPDGKTVMVVFNWVLSNAPGGGDNDPYFSRSLDNGETWSEPEPIYQSAAVSNEVYLDYDSSGVAHVVWQENKGLFYANKGTANADDWTAPPKQIVVPGGIPGVANPSIHASSSNRLDIVWSEGQNVLLNPEPNIYHARSKDGGANWLINAIVQDTGWKSRFPAMAVDSNGVVHLVWQEDDDFPNPERGSIMYAQGIESNGGDISWSTPIKLSPSVNNDAREPKIEIVGNKLHVVYTDVSTTDPTDEQFVYHTQCAAACTNPTNWQLPAEQISGQKVGANGSEPLNVVASLSGLGSCAHVYFHGIHPDLASNEVVFGVNSCNEWGEGLSNRMTSDIVQSINPSMDTQNNWWMYLTYEQGTTTHQIYLHRDSSEVFLPVIFRE